MAFESTFQYAENRGDVLQGSLLLEDVQAAGPEISRRHGRIRLQGADDGLEVLLTHSPATGAFMYTSHRPVTQAWFDLLGFDPDDPLRRADALTLPGQLILGAERNNLVAQGVRHCMSVATEHGVFQDAAATEIICVPVLREGVKYRITEALHQQTGLLCDEVVSDAHHVPDTTVPGYGRRVEIGLFKDADLTPAERGMVRTAIIGDSVASGIVIIGLIGMIRQRFPALERVELFAPLATLRALARIQHYIGAGLKIRAHVFETLLNTLPPDHYFSPQFADPRFHISQEHQAAYREWWGEDAEGKALADSTCAGFGWSEAFFAPREQVRMIKHHLKSHSKSNLHSLLELEHGT